MRTFLNELKTIDDYIAGQLDEDLMVELVERERTDHAFYLSVFLQRKILRLVSFYHRDRMKEKFETLHNKLIQQPKHSGYRRRIEQLFNADKND